MDTRSNDNSNSAMVRLYEFANSKLGITTFNPHGVLQNLTKQDLKVLRRILSGGVYRTFVVDSFIYIGATADVIDKLSTFDLIVIGSSPIEEQNVSKYYFQLTNKGNLLLSIVKDVQENNKLIQDSNTKEKDIYKESRMNIPRPPTDDDIIRRFGKDALKDKEAVITNRHKNVEDRKLAKFLSKRINIDPSDTISSNALFNWLTEYRSNEKKEVQYDE